MKKTDTKYQAFIQILREELIPGYGMYGSRLHLHMLRRLQRYSLKQFQNESKWKRVEV